MTSIFALVNAIFTGVLFASFIWWWNDIGFNRTTLAFQLFAYTLTGAVMWLLVTRAVLYWREGRGKP